MRLFLFLLDPPYPPTVTIEAADRVTALECLEVRYPGSSGHVKRVIENAERQEHP